MPPSLLTNVSDGIHCLSYANVNSYIVEDGKDVLLIDAGLPIMWRPLIDSLEQINRRPDNVLALILTHGHFDHVGFARRAQKELGIPVLVHPKDSYLAAHPYSYLSRSYRLLHSLFCPRSLPVLGPMFAAGALSVKGVPLDSAENLPIGTPLPLPGAPVALHTPGYTRGHCVVHLPERDTLFTGDALVTLDPYTGLRGPRIMAPAASDNIRSAVNSLDILAATGARIVLPGHGQPWTQGVESAVSLAAATHRAT